MESDQERLRKALKKAYEIRMKLDELIAHLGGNFLIPTNAKLEDRDTKEETMGQEECLVMSMGNEE